MGFKCGIIGLPNVGKSTLFNALTESNKAEAANYPFATIEPNVGRVAVPDERLEVLGKIGKSEKIVPSYMDFVDIAGLVKGASQGEGLGNKFLGHVREVDAIAHVVRCFEDTNITHVSSKIDPLDDMETINLELQLADLESLNNKKTSLEKKLKANDKEAKHQFEIINKILQMLDANSILKIDEFAPRLSFFFCCTIEFFEEIAKFRVARKVYAKILKERFHAKNEKSLQLKFHTQTSGESLTAQQPDNNIVRVAMQTMAAVLGGTQSLHTNSRDEALALPTEESAKIALRTQQIVASESGITKTVDPMAGSHYLEELCDEIEEQTWAYLKRIDKMGGSLKAIEKGFFQAEIRQNAYRIKKEVDDSSRVLVGVNKFVDEVEAKQKLLRIDDSLGAKQEKAIKALRKSRDNKKTNTALSKIQAATETDKNIMPFILDSVKTYATTGEISNTLREVFGEYRPKEIF